MINDELDGLSNHLRCWQHRVTILINIVTISPGSINTMRAVYRAGLLLALPCISNCDLRFGSDGLVEYREGEVGIVIAVPHGGVMDSPDIPYRKYGTVEGDDFTKDLGVVVTNSICRYLRRCPHLVISNLKRTKLDPNRDISEAAQQNSKAEKAWREYHGFIDEAKGKEGRGIVIDLHGQSHRRNSTELGYLLSSDQLNRGDFDSGKSSVKQLARITGRSGKDTISGDLGSRILIENYRNIISRFTESWSVSRARRLQSISFTKTACSRATGILSR